MPTPIRLPNKLYFMRPNKKKGLRETLNSQSFLMKFTQKNAHIYTYTHKS